jgi:arylsulfatase A-like enzyme
VLPLLHDPAYPWRTFTFAEYGNARMIADGRYKLIRRYPPHAGSYPDELYDLHSDPCEQRNRVDDPTLTAVVDRLDADLDAHFGRYEDPARSGRTVLSQLIQSLHEPWRLPRPADCPPSGCDMDLLRPPKNEGLAL